MCTIHSFTVPSITCSPSYFQSATSSKSVTSSVSLHLFPSPPKLASTVYSDQVNTPVSSVKKFKQNTTTPLSSTSIVNLPSPDRGVGNDTSAVFLPPSLSVTSLPRSPLVQDLLSSKIDLLSSRPRSHPRSPLVVASSPTTPSPTSSSSQLSPRRLVPSSSAPVRFPSPSVDVSECGPKLHHCVVCPYSATHWESVRRHAWRQHKHDMSHQNPG